MYFGQFMFTEKSFNLVLEPLRDENFEPTGRLVLDTACFHTFVLMNLFNQLNARVLDQHEKNIFKTLFNNSTFWFIVLFEMGLQTLMLKFASTQIGGVLIGACRLPIGVNIACWCLGASVLLVNPLIKEVPVDYF